MLKSFSIKLQVLRNWTLNSCEILKTPYFPEQLQWLLTASGFQLATLLKKRFRQRCFSVNFTKFLGTSFDRILPDDCFLSLSVNCKKFYWRSLLKSTSEKLLISCTSCSISTSRNSEKLFQRRYSSCQQTRRLIKGSDQNTTVIYEQVSSNDKNTTPELYIN